MQHSSESGKQPSPGRSGAIHAALEARIRDKVADYVGYQFTLPQMRALHIFFDLAQEYVDLAFLYHLPVQILRVFFNVRAELYACGEDGTFTRQAPEEGGGIALPGEDVLRLGPCEAGGWNFFPAKGRPGAPLARRNPDSPRENPEEPEILAVLAVFLETPFTGHDRLFYEKFANRLGFSLHNRLLDVKNAEHIEFVRTLVHDIGHNVIVPNLHFKLLMRQMAEKIRALGRVAASGEGGERDLVLRDLCGKLSLHYEEISKNFHQGSFFLETLLRQSHFDQGRYVLQRTLFSFVTRVVAPQLERFRLRFEERGIVLEEESFGKAASAMVDGDVGLLSQVAANIFSNAVKYTRPTPGLAGMKVRCSASLEKDYFGGGKDGIKVAVLSSGPEIPEDEIGKLFSETFRASNAGGEEGTGHGLYFSRLIIAQHGGECGYAREAEGNVFYLVLPVGARP